MDDAMWAKALETLRNYIFKISTPETQGTGFLITRYKSGPLCGIATAYHVIHHSHTWEEPIKIIHTASDKQVILRNPDRFIFANPQMDIAITGFMNEDLDLPETELTLAPEGKYLKQGIQLGWVGYPALAPNHFSFFSGFISCYLNDQKAYLVDGVAINGVSGGPAFTVIGKEKIHLIGLVSAYIPNRAAGESLPGVCFVVGMYSLYKIIKTIRSVEEAREKVEQIEAQQSPSVTANSRR